MRVQLDDDGYKSDFVGFMQQCRCIVVDDEAAGVFDVFLAHDLPERLARAELAAYLSIWERMTPGARATLLD